MTIESGSQRESTPQYTTTEEAVLYYQDLAIDMMTGAAEHFRLASNLPEARRRLEESGCQTVSMPDTILQIHHGHTGALLVEGSFTFQRVAREFKTGKRRVQH